MYLPPFLTGRETQNIKAMAAQFDGIYCDGIYGIKLAEELSKPLFAGTGFNISNRADVEICKAKYFAVSKELTVAEARSVCAENSFYLAAGDLKVMDLVYCPFEKRCANCDRRGAYTLTDENGREFPLRRYVTGACRFELYNCASLAAATPTGALLDCTLNGDPNALIGVFKDGKALREYIKNYTRGHSEQSVFKYG